MCFHWRAAHPENSSRKMKKGNKFYQTCVCKHAFHSILLDTKAQIQKMNVYQQRLMECLSDVLEKHVPLPQYESSTKKKKNKKVQCSCVFDARCAFVFT